MRYFYLHRRDAGAKGGLPAVGMKLNMLVQRLQVITYMYLFYVGLKLYRMSNSVSETRKMQICVNH